MELITRSGPCRCARSEWEARRADADGLLLDLGCGEGGYVRRYAIAHPHELAVGLDSDRAALRRAAQRAARRPERGGAANALFIAADAAAPPAPLNGAADRLTIHFPWSALLRLILADADVFVGLIDRLAASRCRLEIVLNAAAAPDGYAPPTPASLNAALRLPLESARFNISLCDWLPPSDAPPTRWAGRLVKGSKRPMVSLTALRS